MNRLGRLILPLTLVAMVACDSENKTESKPAAAAKAEPAKAEPAKTPPAKAQPKPAAAEAPAEPKAPAVEVSAAMTAFMGELGEHDEVTAAIEKYAAKGLEADMGMYNIAEPSVTATEAGADGETCYAMQAKTGAVQRKFRICWKDDKITAAENKGLAL